MIMMIIIPIGRSGLEESSLEGVVSGPGHSVGYRVDVGVGLALPATL